MWPSFISAMNVFLWKFYKDYIHIYKKNVLLNTSSKSWYRKKILKTRMLPLYKPPKKNTVRVDYSNYIVSHLAVWKIIFFLVFHFLFFPFPILCLTVMFSSYIFPYLNPLCQLYTAITSNVLSLLPLKVF